MLTSLHALPRRTHVDLTTINGVSGGLVPHFTDEETETGSKDKSHVQDYIISKKQIWEWSVHRGPKAKKTKTKTWIELTRRQLLGEERKKPRAEPWEIPIFQKLAKEGTRLSEMELDQPKG